MFPDDQQPDQQPDENPSLVAKLINHLISQQKRSEAVIDKLLAEKNKTFNQFSAFLLLTSLAAQGTMLATDIAGTVAQFNRLVEDVTELKTPAQADPAIPPSYRPQPTGKPKP